MDPFDEFDDFKYIEYLKENGLSDNHFDTETEGEIPDYIIKELNDDYEGPEVIEISSGEESGEDDIEFLYELLPYSKRRHLRGDQPLVHFKPLSKEEYQNSFQDAVNSIPGNFYRCLECKVELIGTAQQFQLAQRSFKPYKSRLCIGCSRFHSCMESEQERRDFINWLITGKLPSYDKQPSINFQSLVTRLKHRRSVMATRLMEKGCDGKNLATTNELYQLCIENNFTCIITGRQTSLHKPKSRRLPYWALSFDHRVPLYDCRYDPEAWSKNNLQIMCSIINNIKGHYSDNEIMRWYIKFLASKVIEL